MMLDAAKVGGCRKVVSVQGMLNERVEQSRMTKE